MIKNHYQIKFINEIKWVVSSLIKEYDKEYMFFLLCNLISVIWLNRSSSSVGSMCTQQGEAIKKKGFLQI